MSLGTGAIILRLVGVMQKCKMQQGGSNWQPFEREPALQATTNQHCHTEGTSVENISRPD